MSILTTSLILQNKTVLCGGLNAVTTVWLLRSECRDHGLVIVLHRLQIEMLSYMHMIVVDGGIPAGAAAIKDAHYVCASWMQ